MSYAVKEIYYTLQGEGAQAGRPAVFCRFTGCNLWSGREEERAEAICSFCDTDFFGVDGPGGGYFATAEDLADAVERTWSAEGNVADAPLVVCTGGEPLLQMDSALIDALRARDMEIAIETNGTRPVPSGVDWVCVSPKAGAELRITSGDELKLVHPQPGAEPEQFVHLDFRHFFLQPMDGPHLERNTELVEEYCRRNRRWKVSVQRHKLLGIK